MAAGCERRGYAVVGDHLEQRLEGHRTELCRLLGWTDEMWELWRVFLAQRARHYRHLVFGRDVGPTSRFKPTRHEAAEWLSELEQRLDGLLKHLIGKDPVLFAALTLGGMSENDAYQLYHSSIRQDALPEPKNDAKYRNIRLKKRINYLLSYATRGRTESRAQERGDSPNEEFREFIVRLETLRNLAKEARISIDYSREDHRHPLCMWSPVRWLVSECIVIWREPRLSNVLKKSKAPNHSNRHFLEFVEILHFVALGDTKHGAASLNLERTVRQEWKLYKERGRVSATGPAEGWAYWMFDPFYQIVWRLRRNR